MAWFLPPPQLVSLRREQQQHCLGEVQHNVLMEKNQHFTTPLLLCSPHGTTCPSTACMVRADGDHLSVSHFLQGDRNQVPEQRWAIHSLCSSTPLQPFPPVKEGGFGESSNCKACVTQDPFWAICLGSFLKCLCILPARTKPFLYEVALEVELIE